MEEMCQMTTDEKIIKNKNIIITGSVIAINFEAKAKYIPGIINKPAIIRYFTVLDGNNVSVKQ